MPLVLILALGCRWLWRKQRSSGGTPAIVQERCCSQYFSVFQRQPVIAPRPDRKFLPLCSALSSSTAASTRSRIFWSVSYIHIRIVYFFLVIWKLLRSCKGVAQWHYRPSVESRRMQTDWVEVSSVNSQVFKIWCLNPELKCVFGIPAGRRLTWSKVQMIVKKQ